MRGRIEEGESYRHAVSRRPPGLPHMTGEVKDVWPTLDAPDDDPWLWLEEVDGVRATAWVAEQKARTIAGFGGPRV